MSEQPRQPEQGLACRKCGCRHLRVVYTRPSGSRIMRRRECRGCGHRTLTYEEAIDAKRRAQ